MMARTHGGTLAPKAPGMQSSAWPEEPLVTQCRLVPLTSIFLAWPMAVHKRRAAETAVLMVLIVIGDGGGAACSLSFCER